MPDPFDPFVTTAPQRPATLAALRQLLVDEDPHTRWNRYFISFDTQQGTVCYHKLDLEAMWPGFQLVIDRLIKQHSSIFIAKHLAQVLQHWLEPGKAIPGTSSYIREVTGVCYIPDDKKFEICGDMYSVTTLAKTVEIPCRAKRGYELVSARWLDHYYPGAKQQVLMLHALGITDHLEVGAQALHGQLPTSPPVDPTVLQGLTLTEP